MVQEMLGHSSIVLTADTYTSVLPEVAHTAAEKTAAHLLHAAGTVPGTNRRRGKGPVRRKRRAPRNGPARLPLPERRATARRVLGPDHPGDPARPHRLDAASHFRASAPRIPDTRLRKANRIQLPHRPSQSVRDPACLLQTYEEDQCP
ncbi:hypothetical protein [Actinomadura macra]|uniref:hypothetical protein n=1 Tax=Actinomadura macra TaxID=46164 RepID=UPI000831122A|nr:hypothetical protein [Actinomadura macra]